MSEVGPSVWQAALKRAADIAVAVGGLVSAGPILVLAIVASRIETGEAGIYVQHRIGRGGQPFPLMKIRTMRSRPSGRGTVTVRGDARITRLGRILRRFKIDELPQLVNVLVGDMSLVGPRPDVRGYADRLVGSDRLVLSVRPGLTGPATLAYRNEEDLLATTQNAVQYNDEVIWPKKVQINVAYIQNYTLRADVICLMRTAASLFAPAKTARAEQWHDTGPKNQSSAKGGQDT